MPLPPGQQLAAPGKWPIVGERTPGPGPDVWTLTLADADGREVCWTLDQLKSLPSVSVVVDLHCVTRWSQPNVPFTGVLLRTLLSAATCSLSTHFVSFVARSERRHSTSLPLPDAIELGTLIAWEAQGRPLESIHGGPLRCIVPGRYFYKSVKWLERIELLREDRLGYWEAQAGYHNHADPWREERYLAPTLDRYEAARVLAARDFQGRDLRSLDARGRDLSGLRGAGALLRDADFRNCDLTGACFDRANLSNARLAGANLRGARFVGADLEGADFAAADLRGADFTSASLFGASFAPLDANGNAMLDQQAKWDDSTRLDRERLEDLMPAQRALFR
jgi:hypothetical protein